VWAVANITKTPAGSYRVLIRRKGLKTVCKTFPLMKEAKVFAAESETRIKGIKLEVPIPVVTEYTIAQLMDTYALMRKTNNKEIVKKNSEWHPLLRIRKYFGHLNARDINKTILIDYCTRQSATKISPNQNFVDISKLGTIYNYATSYLELDFNEKLITKHWKTLKMMGLTKRCKSRDRRPTHKELTDILDKLEQPYKDVTRFASITGIGF
jgi:acyl carrier protein phosphodiesterase